MIGKDFRVEHPYHIRQHDFGLGRHTLVERFFPHITIDHVFLLDQYSYEELWQPKNILVTFRMYQLNFDGQEDRVYKKYWDKYPVHFIEVIEDKKLNYSI